MEITLLRHGQTRANADGILQGQGQSSLTELGREQVRTVATRLDLSQYDVVEGSDLDRAQETAELLGPGFVASAAWRELNIGRWEDMTWAEIRERYADEVDRLRAGEDVRFGGAETLTEFAVRVRRALEDLAARMTESQRALVITHGGVINDVVKLVTGAPVRSRRFGRSANTALTRLRRDDGRWSLASFNDAAHLSEEASFVVERLQQGRRVAFFETEAGGHGKTWEEEGRRLAAGVEEALAASEDGRVGMTGPDDAIRAYLCRILEIPPPEKHRLGPLGQGTRSTLVFEEYGAVVADYNVAPLS